VEDLDFPTYLALAYRVSAYPGVMQARHQEAERRERRTGTPRGARRVDSTREAITADPLLRDAISFG
jgi:hypothetical protein